MRVRALSSSGDYTFGRGSQSFFVDSPQLVVQKILTGLKLFRGEFFLNISAGMPWNQQVLGFQPQGVYDNAIRTQIRNAPGVTGITSYSSVLNTVTRALAVTVAGTSAYGPWSISTSLSFAPPASGGYGVGGYGVNPYGA
jgi:hypothetical protein